MKLKKKTDGSSPKKRLPPASTPEARENQLIALAYDLVEQRLLDGTATSQETTHFLKRASTKEKERIEMEILERQKELITAKTEALQSAKHMEELYNNAVEAMKRYSGHSDEEDSSDDSFIQ